MIWLSGESRDLRERTCLYARTSGFFEYGNVQLGVDKLRNMLTVAICMQKIM